MNTEVKPNEIFRKVLTKCFLNGLIPMKMPFETLVLFIAHVSIVDVYNKLSTNCDTDQVSSEIYSKIYTPAQQKDLFTNVVFLETFRITLGVLAEVKGSFAANAVEEPNDISSTVRQILGMNLEDIEC